MQQTLHTSRVSVCVSVVCGYCGCMCECECAPVLHARKAYGPWRACASVCLLARVVCVCSPALHSAGLHRAVQVLVLVHAACAARALRA